MKTISPLSRKFAGRVFLVPALAVVMAQAVEAQQAPHYQNQSGHQTPPAGYQYQQHRPGVGERVGGFVRRLFYGERAPSQHAPQPQYNNHQTARSLDRSPMSGQRYEPPAPSQPPAPRPSASAPPSSSPPKTASAPPNKTTVSKPAASSSKYTPPKIQSSPPPAKTQSTAVPKTESTPPPQPKPEPKIEPKIEQEPPVPKLDNTPTESVTNVASLNKSSTLQEMDIAAIKEPEKTFTSPAPSTTNGPKDNGPPSAAASAGQFMVGKKTAVPGRVVSPYPPYQELDVTGLASGSLALDPTTDKVFEIP